MSDDTNYERWRQLYEKVQGQQRQIDELVARIGGGAITSLPAQKQADGDSVPLALAPEPTEHEKDLALLKEWGLYYKVNHQPDKSLLVAHYKSNWYLAGILPMFGPGNKHARSVLAAIQAAELERAAKLGYTHEHHYGYRFFSGPGRGKIAEKSTLLAALLELRRREEKKDVT